MLELPSRAHSSVTPHEQGQDPSRPTENFDNSDDTRVPKSPDATDLAVLAEKPTLEEPIPSKTIMTTIDTATHRWTATRPIVPAIPIATRKPPTLPTSPPPLPLQTNGGPEGHLNLESDSNVLLESVNTQSVQADAPPAPLPKQPPKSWAALLRTDSPIATTSQQNNSVLNGVVMNGTNATKGASLSDILRGYDVGKETRVSFIEPRGLVNTGNMCYMNSVSSWKQAMDTRY